MPLCSTLYSASCAPATHQLRRLAHTFFCVLSCVYSGVPIECAGLSVSVGQCWPTQACPLHVVHMLAWHVRQTLCASPSCTSSQCTESQGLQRNVQALKESLTTDLERMQMCTCCLLHAALHNPVSQTPSPRD